MIDAPQSIFLKGLPFPPSSNSLYVNNPRTRGRFPSKDLVKFRSDFDDWVFKSVDDICRAKMIMNSWEKISPGIYCLRLELVSNKWFNKDGSIKKMDLANREKALVDSVCGLLRIDDSAFFSIEMVKLSGDIPKVDLCIYPMQDERNESEVC